MKPHGDSDVQLVDLIATQAESVGVEVNAECCETLIEHMRLVLRANRSFNLTTITRGIDVVGLHIVDSLVAVPDIISIPAGRLADIGSGAGYPGIPLAVVCRRMTTLFESVNKKATFLLETVAALGLESRIKIAGRRSEELSEDERGKYTVVTARAVSSLPTLLELASPLLSIGGQLVAYKGIIDAEERSRGEEAARLLGFSYVGERRIFLPGGGQERTIVRFEKVGEPAISLPRRPGLAHRRPLV